MKGIKEAFFISLAAELFFILIFFILTSPLRGINLTIVSDDSLKGSIFFIINIIIPLIIFIFIIIIFNIKYKNK